MSTITTLVDKNNPNNIMCAEVIGPNRPRYKKPTKPIKLESEPFFRCLLKLEYKRTERTNKHFCLVLIDIGRKLSRKNSADLAAILMAVNESTRETDVTGWYRTNKIIGMIYSDVVTSTAPLVVDKLKRKLSQFCSEEQLKALRVIGIPFPDTSGENIIADRELYNSLHGASPLFDFSRVLSLLLKRTVDVGLSIIALVICSPFFAVIATSIKLSSPGPVFFRQERIGFGGRKFTMYKFRSMKVNNNSSAHKQFVVDFIQGKDVGQQCGNVKVMKMANDPRITKIGHFLRKSSLDELPQLFNVLKGDMSFVGPRPPVSYEVEAYSLWHRRRVMDAKPGITGIWQVYGRSITDFANMVRMDINYIERQSLLLDLKLMVLTPFAVFSTRGAV